MPRRPSVQEVCARVARTFRDQRLNQNLSLTRLAEGAGLSRQMVSYIEQEKRIPTLETMVRIARVLEIDLGSIITEAMRER